jgi:hypothetical protein
VLVLAALCPALLAGAVSAWQSAAAERAMARARLDTAATILAAALDHEIAGLVTTLESLAQARWSGRIRADRGRVWAPGPVPLP